MFDRLISLIGTDKHKQMILKKILIIGIGGVGGYVLEALVRSGFKDITIIDYDIIDISNLNRQIITDSSNVGLFKVDEAVKRAKLINPNVSIYSLNIKVDDDNLDNILSLNYDYIIDACDSINVKYLLMKNKEKYKYKLISCMGTAKKMDPSKLNITTLDKTSYDPLARKLRYMLRKNNIKGKFTVVSSLEEVVMDGNILGSVVTVPAVARFYLASYVINDIVNS